MPENALVSIHYGAYESCGVVDHSKNRLEGLERMLTNNGHRVELVKIEDWNIVELWVNGEMVFKCDIQSLNFGGDGQLDDLCQTALKTVWKAY